MKNKAGPLWFWRRSWRPSCFLVTVFKRHNFLNRVFETVSEKKGSLFVFIWLKFDSTASSVGAKMFWVETRAVQLELNPLTWVLR